MRIAKEERDRDRKNEKSSAGRWGAKNETRHGRNGGDGDKRQSRAIDCHDVNDTGDLDHPWPAR